MEILSINAIQEISGSNLPACREKARLYAMGQGFSNVPKLSDFFKPGCAVGLSVNSNATVGHKTSGLSLKTVFPWRPLLETRVAESTTGIHYSLTTAFASLC